MQNHLDEPIQKLNNFLFLNIWSVGEVHPLLLSHVGLLQLLVSEGVPLEGDRGDIATHYEE